MDDDLISDSQIGFRKSRLNLRKLRLKPDKARSLLDLHVRWAPAPVFPWFVNLVDSRSFLQFACLVGPYSVFLDLRAQWATCMSQPPFLYFFRFSFVFFPFFVFYLRTGKMGCLQLPLFVKFCEANQDKDFERRPIFTKLLF